MTVIVGRKASATGFVIVGHNEDDDWSSVVRHGYVPEMDHMPGETLPAEAGRARIPQVSHTRGFYWSEVCGPNGGLSASDLMVNDRGVYVCSDSAGVTREDGTDSELLTDGGVAYNVRRAVAERASTAREGAEIIMDLARTWGYALSGRLYIVADAVEAYVVQLVRGRRFLAARVPDDAVAAIPNNYVIRSAADAEDVVYSEDLVNYAVGKGWLREGDAFDFYRAYQADANIDRPVNVDRQFYTLLKLTGQRFDRSRLPFAVKAPRQYGIRDVMDALSNHYEDLQADIRTGTGRSPHSTEITRVCRDTTIESTIVQFAPMVKELTLWTAYGRPCAVPYLPIHPLYGAPDAVDRMEDPAACLTAHLTKERAYSGRQGDGWQAFRDFCNELEFFYAACEADLKAVQTAWRERKIVENDRRTEPAQVFDDRQVREALDLLAKFAEAHFHMIPVDAWAPAGDERGAVVFDSPETPSEESLVFCAGGPVRRTRTARAISGSLEQIGSGRYQFSFKRDEMISEPDDAVADEFYLGFATESGNTYVGTVRHRL
ncbi:MAG: C69 family dipeptidase [Clostridia bacterium]|nr:C69 family dipeptidase [Clostridia bacterium]